MDHKIVHNLKEIQNEVKLKKKNINIIAVSKTFSFETIEPLLNYGHIHFGENKVQEAIQKWQTIKPNYKNLKLHLIGKLQSNKVKYVLPLFDYIHSLDNEKLAEKISTEQIKKNFRPKIFIQVNIGTEVQKNGIEVKNLDKFYELCLDTYNLDIIGLMCIPPANTNPDNYFKKMDNLNKEFGLNNLSMGMSNDYKIAINHGATFIRVGSKIFGERSS